MRGTFPFVPNLRCATWPWPTLQAICQPILDIFRDLASFLALLALVPISRLLSSHRVLPIQGKLISAPLMSLPSTPKQCGCCSWYWHYQCWNNNGRDSFLLNTWAESERCTCPCASQAVAYNTGNSQRTEGPMPVQQKEHGCVVQFCCVLTRGSEAY